MRPKRPPRLLQKLRPRKHRLLRKLRPHARDLVDAFGYGPEHIRAAIASGAEAERQAEAAEHYRAARAAGASFPPRAGRV